MTKRDSSVRYWKVYELDPEHPDYREYCGIFKAKTAYWAVRKCQAYHRDHTLRALRDTLEAEETTDERLYPSAH